MPAPMALRQPDEIREWVEKLAAQLEKDGLPRMAGRIFAWLLVCDPSEQSMDELATALQGSKASMSTMTRLLEGAALVERIRRPGERSDVFRLPEGRWSSFWEAQLERLRTITQTLERGAALLSHRAPSSRRRIVGVLAQYRFLERELPHLFARWHESSSDEDLAPARSGHRSSERGATARKNNRRIVRG